MKLHGPIDIIFSCPCVCDKLDIIQVDDKILAFAPKVDVSYSYSLFPFVHVQNADHSAKELAESQQSAATKPNESNQVGSFFDTEIVKVNQWTKPNGCCC